MQKVHITLSWLLIITTTAVILSFASVFFMWLIFEVLARIL